jgi:hypothetical protein
VVKCIDHTYHLSEIRDAHAPRGLLWHSESVRFEKNLSPQKTKKVSVLYPTNAVFGDKLFVGAVSSAYQPLAEWHGSHAILYFSEFNTTSAATAMAERLAPVASTRDMRYAASLSNPGSRCFRSRIASDPISLSRHSA